MCCLSEVLLPNVPDCPMTSDMEGRNAIIAGSNTIISNLMPSPLHKDPALVLVIRAY